MSDETRHGSTASNEAGEPGPGAADDPTNERAKHWSVAQDCCAVPALSDEPQTAEGEPAATPIPQIPDDVPLQMVPRPKRGGGGALAKLLVLAFLLGTAWNVRRAMTPVELATVEAEEAAARFELYLLGQEIEAHLQARGALPASLVQVGELGDNVGYRPREDGTFTLSTEVSGRRVLYRPGTEDAVYESLVERIAGGPVR